MKQGDDFRQMLTLADDLVAGRSTARQAEWQALVRDLVDQINDYENGISWFTTCANCARLLDQVYDRDRLRDGLRRLKSGDYDAGYTPEQYADALLGGTEPTGEPSL